MYNDTLKHLSFEIKTNFGFHDHVCPYKNYLNSVHNKYMLQVQTLINQKAIEAPGTKKPWWKFW